MTMKCPECGAPRLVRDVRDVDHTYKGEVTRIRTDSCGAVILDATESERVSGLMLAFNRDVNAAAVDPAFITRVRKKLQLDQREAARVFGGGVNAFSRYETGKTRPPVALMKLLKVLDRHPELLNEVRAA
jgi:HTH-type transcriptional regulator/antitoxin MqsA